MVETSASLAVAPPHSETNRLRSQMVEFGVFLYGFCAGLVLMNAQRSRRTKQPLSPMMTALGWGLMSMSTVLALLLFSVALAMAMGAGGQLLHALAAG